MPRRPAYRRKPRAKKAARKGKKSNNTKAQVNAQFKLFQNFTTIPSSTGTAGNVGYSLFSPMNGTACSVNQSNEFLIQSKMYDEFCVRSLKVTYLPGTNINNLVTGVGNGTTVDLHSWVDRDGGTPVNSASNSPQQIQAYDSAKRGNIMRKHVRRVTCKPFWVDCNQNVLMSPYQLTAPYAQAGLLQLVGFYTEKIPITAATTLGTFVIEWNVSFRGKKSMNLTYDPISDSIIMTPLSSYPALPHGNPPLSEKDVLSFDQTLSCDASGNLVITSNYDGTVAVALAGTGN